MIDDIISATESLVNDEFNAAPGLFDPQLKSLPLRLKRTNPAERESEDLVDAVSRWLADDRRSPISILSAVVGGGKTIATCVLQRTLQQRVDREKAVVWIRMASCRNLQVYHSHQLIPSLLGVPGTHDPSREVAMVILDGIDEYLCLNPERQGVDQLSTILEHLQRSAIPVLISGRDFAIHPSPIYHRFRDTIAALCRRGRAAGPEQWELEPWSDSVHLRNLLVERLEALLPPDRKQLAQEQLSRIQDGVLCSPLLFGLATESLADHLRKSENVPEIRDEWELTHNWVIRCLERDNLRCATPPSERQRIAQKMALYLAISGRGVSGIKPSELDHEDCAWIWTSQADPESSPNPGSGATFLDPEVRLNDLLNGCLLQMRNGYLAPFHQQILVHLAAEGLDNLASTNLDLDFGVRLHSPFVEAIWKDIGSKIQLSGIGAVGNCLSRCVGGSALNPNSELDQTLRYWVAHKLSDKKAPAMRFTGFLDSKSAPTLRDRRIVGAAAQFLNALPLREHAHSRPGNITIEGRDYAVVPKGAVFLWDTDADGNVVPVLCEIPAAFLLATTLVTVAQYREFLQTRGEDFSTGNYGLNLDLAEHSYVRGVSAREAQQYCDWLSARLVPNASLLPGWAPTGRVVVPHSCVLRYAASGEDLRRIHWDESGPFGHANLLCFLWQHTGDSLPSHQSFSDACVTVPLRNHRVFGGSENLAGNPAKAESPSEHGDRLDRAAKIFYDAYPSYTREVSPESRSPDFGVRVGIELLPIHETNEPLVIQITSPGPPGGDPLRRITRQELKLVAWRLTELMRPSDVVIQDLLRIRGLAHRSLSSKDFWLDLLADTAGASGDRAEIIRLLEELMSAARNRRPELSSALQKVSLDVKRGA